MITDVVDGLGAGVGVDVSPDGATAYVVEWSNGELIRVDLGSGAVQTVLSGLSFPQDVIVDWATGRIFVSERTGTIRQVFGSDSRVIANPGGAPHQLALSPGGDRLFTVGYDSGKLHMVELATGIETALAGGLGHPVGLVIDPGVTTAYVTEQDSGSLFVVDLASGAVTARHGGLVAPFFLAWDKDGTGIYCVQRDPANSLVHLSVGPPIAVLSQIPGLDWRPSGVAPTPDDSLIYVTTDRKLQVISAGPLPPRVPPPAPFVVQSVRFESDRSQAIPLQYQTGAAVPTPEWTLGGPSHPAAYPMGTLARIQVTFRRQAGYVPGSYAVGGTGNLGGVRRTTVTPVFDATGLSTPLTFEFMWPLPSAVDAGTVSIDWYARPVPGPAIPVAVGSTAHRIYTVLNRPTVAPWNTVRPWVEALERACTWAAGVGDADAAAAAITQAYNGSGLVSYDTVSGATAYGWTAFNLSEMLERLAGGPGLGNKVNCTDSANTVSTLANVVGCELWQSRMESSFMLNPVVAIGYNVWEVPFGSGFSYHEVAWKGGATAADQLFDGCLHVDGDADPGSGPHTLLLPLNMTFGDCSALNYRRRLCPQTPNGCVLCQPQPATRQRRPVI